MLKEDVEKIIHDYMMEYANYVITNRAIPDIRDGLKPAQRRILITMNENPDELIKAQNIDGQVMKLHPHGSTYNVAVGMVQEDNNLTPLIDGRGSFGQHTSSDLKPSASRYTAIKLSDLGKENFEDIKYDTVDFVSNYDDKETMPEVLPVKFPAILHYNQSGIAVGMNCNIPSYNLIELNTSVINYILHGEANVLYPDFVTGGFIENNLDNILNVHLTGTGTFKLRAKIEVDKNVLKIHEIPYTTTREAIISSIVKCVQDKKITEIVDVKDLTGLEGMLVEITCKKYANINHIINLLYKFTPLESYFSANINVLIDGLPKVLPIPTIIEEWVKWRRECIRRRLRFDKNKTQKEIRNSNALYSISHDLKKCIKIITETKNDKETIEKLCETFDLWEEQAKYISELRLKSLNIENISRRLEEFDKLSDHLNFLNKAIYSDKMIDEIIIKELEEINRKYGKPRKTQICEFKNLEVIESPKKKNEIWEIKVTKDGYVKKLTTSSKFKMKENDKVVAEATMKNDDEILAFTNNGIFKFKVSEIGECKNDLGCYLYNIASNMGEVIDYALITESTKYILNIYQNNKIAKVDINSYLTVNNRRNLIYEPTSKLMKVIPLNDDENDLELGYENKIIYINTKYFRVKKCRSSNGATMPRKLF